MTKEEAAQRTLSTALVHGLQNRGVCDVAGKAAAAFDVLVA
jgi:hypothetical protein